MKSHFDPILCVLLFIVFSVFSSSVGELSLWNPYGDGLSRSPGRSLLSLAPEHSTALIAGLDGTVHLVESNSKRVIWSFASGTPIYTSYQAPFREDNDKENASGPNGRFFIDCGDDWELYMHTEHFGRMKLSMSIDEFVKNTPYISEDGAVTLGSKKTTVFEVDLRTGKLIRTYRFDSPSTLRSDETQSVSYYNTANKELVKSGTKNPDIVDLRLHITRTDYTLTSFARDSEKTSWNMTIAEVGASLLCLDSSSGVPLNFPDKPGSEIGIDFAIPLSCHTRGPVFRHRSHTLLESSRSEGLPGAHLEDMLLLMPPSGLMIPTQPKVDEFIDIQQENVMLPAPTPNFMLPLRPKTNVHHSDDREAMLPLPPMEIDETVDVHDMIISLKHMLSMFFEWSTALPIILFVVILVVSFVKGYVRVVKEQGLLNEQPYNSSSKTASSKRKKNRKSGKYDSVERKDKHVSSENGDVFAHVDCENKMSLHLDKLLDGSTDGRRIGKLFVSNTEIAKGSNGTIVLEGFYEGRPVAVKRLVQAHNDVAFKEIQNLIASDRHPNIVRWYGVEYDQDFVYLSLERCTCSLGDLIQISLGCSQYPMFNKDQATRGMIEYKAHLDSVKDFMPGLNLWRANGYPSPLLLKIMRDMVSGLVHLHELGIIHRDLKPQNVLIIKESSVCAKLSDMGISKRLVENMSSLGHHATGCGSSGWQAPEQLLHGRQTRAVDLFSLGCVIFSCITGGRHPFGNHLERDINIVKNQMDLFLVEHIPEALDLISRLLNPDPELRPKASEVLHHPLFWSSEMRLSFLRDTSDRVELEDRETHSNLMQALERIGLVALGGKWDEKMETAFITNIGHYRRYKFDSVRDLLRVMRNKLNHYGELPKEIQCKRPVTMNMFWLLVLIFCYGIFIGTGTGVRVSPRPSVVNIGAIISFNSSIGKVAKVAIEAAVQDVNSNPEVLKGTQLKLAMQDTKQSSGFLGIVEALRFMENDTVAIVGPQESVLAHVISHIANELQVPLLSFAATDPTLNSLQFPYFVRTTQSDLFQMSAVAEIVNYFEWRDVIAIYIDDDHGRNGVAALGDKLAEKRCKISYRAPMSPKLSRNEISNTLLKVALMESRVIILHIYATWGLEVVDVARNMEMMGSGYVWIATDWLSTLLDTESSLPPAAMDSIQGVLTLRMHTPKSELKRKFVSRWSNLTTGVFGLNTYGLYAYDTVWLLAHALDAFLNQGGSISFLNDSSLTEFHGGNLHFDTMSIFDGGNKLLTSILDVNISGVTGPIKFTSDGNLIGTAYEVINVIGTGMRRIGYWSNYFGLSVVPPEEQINRSSSNNLYGVIWPGQTIEKPRGWVFSSNGRQLRVGVPVRISFQEFATRVEGSDVFHGYCIDVFNAALALLPYAVPYKFIPFGDGHIVPIYTDLLQKITTNEFDAVVGDITITTNRTKIVDFTQPYIESGLVVVAPVRKLNSSAWAFLRPFTPMMWCVTGLFFLAVGVVVWILERRTNDDFRGPPRKQFATIVWFSFSTLFTAHKEKIDSALGRFVLLIWLFVVLILNSSYTASLTSILTVEQLSYSIKGIESLIISDDPVGYQRGSFTENYLMEELNIHKSRLVPLDSAEEFEKALNDGPNKGGVAAVVDKRAYMELFLSSRCQFGIVGQEFTKMGWGFAFPRESALAVDMSTAILKLSESGELQKIHDKWLSRQACSSEGAKQEVDRLPLKSFWGLFLLCGLACFVALLFYLIKMVHQYMRHSDRSSQSAPISPIRSFLSFVQEQENDVHKMEEPENSEANRKRRKRVSNGRIHRDESVNISNVGTCLCWR